MSVQVFRTRKDAQRQLERMHGWPDAKIVKLYFPDHELALQSGNVWVIEATDQPEYLHKDGYVKNLWATSFTPY